MNKITLDGKNIKFPVSFDSLGNKYKEFNNVDYLNFTNKMNHIGPVCVVRVGVFRTDGR